MMSSLIKVMHEKTPLDSQWRRSFVGYHPIREIKIRPKCSICSASVEQGAGHAIFTAECSHTFHFNCISSYMKQGNQVCPVCNVRWIEIPLQSGFDDDESLDHQSPSANPSFSESESRTMQVKTYTEVPAVSQSSAPDNFTVLINLKAPASASVAENPTQVSESSRVPVDLVTVLDISGSMKGTKLELLKQAMGFLIQNLGPNDRLSVIAFSDTARRLFPLCRMSESGKQQAMQAVNLLKAEGSTNIADGLNMGAKVVEDSRYKNPVASIMLLSDGQDNHTFRSHWRPNYQPSQQPNYRLLLPSSINSGKKIPVHTFGFGADHDASLMHSISEISGGTFSFIENENLIQDAFAQCIGGLLSVVVKDLQVNIECVDSRVTLSEVKSGSYSNQVTQDGRQGKIDVGDLYDDEERDFLVTVKVPTEISSSETALLKVSCVYNDTLTKETVTATSEEVRISRPEVAGHQDVSMEVDRQLNRILATEAMALAQAAAEEGDLTGAASILENCRKKLLESVSAKSHDILCLALEAELKEMKERLSSRAVYEKSGRAYLFTGRSSHGRQRATALPEGSDSDLDACYQTPKMAAMVNLSKATRQGIPSTQRNYSTQRLIRRTTPQNHLMGLLLPLSRFRRFCSGWGRF